MPAVNGIGTAASIAKAYGCAAAGGTEIGLTPGTLKGTDDAAAPPSAGRETRYWVSIHRSLWIRQTVTDDSVRLIGSGLRNSGAGGSFGFADQTPESDTATS